MKPDWIPECLWLGPMLVDKYGVIPTATVVYFIAIVLAAWPWLGYPAWLWLLGRFFRSDRVVSEKSDNNTDNEPMQSVSIVVSAFNEADIIKEKLTNIAGLNYPKAHLECIVVSDCSDDGTDEVVNNFSESNVRLFRTASRCGKSAGLTRFVPECRHDLIVFTDANAIYQNDAIDHLVKHFREPNVGYVVGQQRYVETNGDDVSKSEGLYWKYETLLKQWESRIDSVVGGDGAIYAIRRGLFKPLRDDDINDFTNPLQIIQSGYRGIYEPKAVCTEHVAGSFGGEYRRKVRIANRSFRAFIRERGAANPLRTGLFAFHLLSHKLLRWFTAYFLIAALGISGAVALTGHSKVFACLFISHSMFYGLALMGLFEGLRGMRLVSVPFYFCLGTVASAHGILLYCMGHRCTTWQPERVGRGQQSG
jgi:cellulose synthase/poly-beta-1,6-N-acetylglucosamine synthase-like glycosyltransferase